MRADINTYGITLAQVLDMVKGGEFRGPHYDAMVKLWAAQGATLVGDAATFESLCFQNGEANSNDIANSLARGQSQTKWLFIIAFLLSLALTLRMICRVKQVVSLPGADSAVASAGARSLGAS